MPRLHSQVPPLLFMSSLYWDVSSPVMGERIHAGDKGQGDRYRMRHLTFTTENNFYDPVQEHKDASEAKTKFPSRGPSVYPESWERGNQKV